MTDNSEIETRLRHFADNIERWRIEAARLTLRVSEARQGAAAVEDLVALEETATAIYADVSSFRETVEEVAKQSPEAASQLAGVNDALHLVLLEITELGIKFYETHSGLPELSKADG
jgi:hypothetical protein